MNIDTRECSRECARIRGTETTGVVLLLMKNARARVSHHHRPHSHQDLALFPKTTTKSLFHGLTDRPRVRFTSTGN